MVEFDTTTYIVVAKDEEDLLDLLHKRDSGFQKEVDRGIVYMWDLRTIDPVEVTVINQDKPKIVFVVSH
jgi:hypothetical protein